MQEIPTHLCVNPIPCCSRFLYPEVCIESSGIWGHIFTMTEFLFPKTWWMYVSKREMYFCGIGVVPDTFPLHIKCDEVCKGELFNSLSLKAQAPESSSNPFRESWSFHNGHKSRQLHSGGE